MAFKFPNIFLELFTIIMCVAMLNPKVQAQPPPPPVAGVIPLQLPWKTSKAVQHCWSHLANISGCHLQIYGSLFSGQIRAIGPVCCKAIADASSDCWSTLFPFSPFFPALVKSICGQYGGLALAPATNGFGQLPTSKISFGKPGNYPNQCISSITAIKGCLSKIYGSLRTGNFSIIGPACCGTIKRVTYTCWSTLFPYNPFFPPLLKAFCAVSGGNRR